MDNLAQRVASLSPEQRELMLRRIPERTPMAEAATIRRHTEDETRLPLSFAQKRLWFLDRLVPGLPVYTVFGTVRLQALLRLGLLERSINEIIRRHEILRTQFEAVSGEPVQVILRQLQITVPVTNLAHLAGEEREREAVRIATEESARPFDLMHAPLLRAGLLRLS